MQSSRSEKFLWCPDGYTPVSEIARVVRRWTKAGKIPDTELIDCILDYGDQPDPLVIGPELISGRLRSAGVMVDSGALIALPKQDWRRGEWVGENFLYATAAACAGMEISVGSVAPYGRCQAIVALRDLAIQVGHIDPPAAPNEIPPGWEAAVQSEGAGLQEGRAPPKGGRPTSHDWEAFWIEVAQYAALNGLDREHRRELQKHMQEWVAAQSANPMDEATIRRKLGAVIQARNRAKLGSARFGPVASALPERPALF